MGTRRRLTYRFLLVSTGSVIGAIALWQLASRDADPTLFPTPSAVVDATREAIENGTLRADVAISLRRVLLGWALGSVIALPIGVLAGTSRYFRAAIDPFIHFFRFVPALALVSLFMLWFGIGEASKVNLIAWASGFVVAVTTAAGASSVHPDKLDAARCFGASRVELITQVVLPATVPAIFTGMRLALANAFLVVVAAEALAAQSGIGFMVWNARTYFRTDQIFVGVLCFGVLGFCLDRLWKLFGAVVLGRFLRGTGDY